jgi:hypothetical protein
MRIPKFLYYKVITNFVQAPDSTSEHCHGDSALGYTEAGAVSPDRFSAGSCRERFGLAVEACYLGARLRAVGQGLGFGQEGDRLGDFGVPGGGDFETFGLAELALEELALDAGFQPVAYAGDVRIGVFDVLRLEEVLELLHDRIVDGEVVGDGVIGEIVLTEVEEGVVLWKWLALGESIFSSGVMPPPP